MWEFWHREKLFVDNTNFYEPELNDLVQLIQLHVANERRRGPPPKSSWPDCILTYLSWAKFALEYKLGARLSGMKAGRYEEDVDRGRRVLLAGLKERWWDSRQRPVPLTGTIFPHVGILIDTQTTETFRPKVLFSEAKIYWDEKNHVYGIKKEVGVMAHEPHYCLFTQPGVPGSVHDYARHKEIYDTYLPYLEKTPEERFALPADQANAYWAGAFDKGYIGPASDTPHLRRITPVKKAVTHHEQEHNHAVNRIRVPVEQFFGRMWKSWKILRGVPVGRGDVQCGLRHSLHAHQRTHQADRPLRGRPGLLLQAHHSAKGAARGKNGEAEGCAGEVQGEQREETAPRYGCS